MVNLLPKDLRHDEKEYAKEELVMILEKEMLGAAEALDFEKAAELRDQIEEIKAAPEMGGTMKRKQNKRAKRRGEDD